MYIHWIEEDEDTQSPAKQPLHCQRKLFHNVYIMINNSLTNYMYVYFATKYIMIIL